MSNKTNKVDRGESTTTKAASTDQPKSEKLSKIADEEQSTDKQERSGFQPSSLPSNLAELYAQVEEKMEIIIDKKLENEFLMGMIKPLSKIQHKVSGKKSAPAYKRTAVKVAISGNDVAAKEAENDASALIKQFKASSESEKQVLANMKLKLNSQSTSYISRNKKNLKKRLEALITKRGKNPNQAFKKLISSSGIKKAEGFDSLFFEFLKQHDNQLHILCTGVSSFKDEIWVYARKLFRGLR